MNIICDDKNILNILKEEENRIIDFFGIKSNYNIYVKILNYDDFKREFESYLECQLNDYVTGFIEDDSNTIVYLKYEDFNKTIHKDDSYEDYKKIIIHEFVHIIHSIYCNKNYPDDSLYEGVAYYLANQTSSNYYDDFKRIINDKTHDEILSMLK